MNIKIRTFNEDGSIAFEGVFNKEEASLVLEVGTNYLLAQGALGGPDDDDDAQDNFNPDPDTPVQ